MDGHVPFAKSFALPTIHSGAQVTGKSVEVHSGFTRFSMGFDLQPGGLAAGPAGLSHPHTRTKNVHDFQNRNGKLIRGGRGGNREHSDPASATPPTSKARHPSQLLPEQSHIHLVEVKYCEGTRPKNQLGASKQQHCDLRRDLSRASAHVTLHWAWVGVRLRVGFMQRFLAEGANV
eukprot:1147513-Pelagomonas_calceolata.AAC.2